MTASNGRRNGAVDVMDASSTNDASKGPAGRRQVVPTVKSAARRAEQGGEEALRAVQGQVQQRPLLTLGLCAAGAFALGVILRPRFVQLAALAAAGYTAWRLSEGRTAV